MSDDATTLAEQYADADNLNARIRLHAEHSTASQSFGAWRFDRVREAVEAAAAEADGAAADAEAGGVAAADAESEDVAAADKGAVAGASADLDDARLLEVGCGPGDLWADNAGRVSAGWSVYATDFSAGMVEEFREATAAADLDPGPVGAAAAEALPFPDDSFDVAVANHVLYHVDRERALPELRRVLRPGGRLVATTNGEDNMAELCAMLERAGADWIPSAGEFSLQNGPDQLRREFDAVERHDFDNALRVPDAEPLVAYAASLPDVDDDAVERFAELAREAVADGPLMVDKEVGALVARVEP